jgi:fructose-1,6-bisphosphatase I
MQPLPQCLVQDQVAPDLASVILSLTTTTREIAARVHQGALAGVLGSAAVENVQGETQKNLDVIANELLKNALAANPQVLAVASEEEEFVVAANSAGKFVVAFDPLDGSSNIDINGQIGTIFTIYPALQNEPANSAAHFLQGGAAQLCAGYVLYGAATLLVITMADTASPTRCFTLDASSGEFLLTESALVVPPTTQEFAANMATQRFWAEDFKRYIGDLLLGETGARGKRFNMRWNAAMVGDVHRVLMRGGVFLYPRDTRNQDQPAKLRLLYEANPMALLTEHAGGKAFGEGSAGIVPILALKPESLHQRVSVFLGSAEEVDTCLSYLKG